MNEDTIPKKHAIITWTKDDSFMINDFSVYYVPTDYHIHDLAMELRGIPRGDIGRHCAGWDEMTFSSVLLRLLCYWPTDKEVQCRILKELSKIEEWSEEIDTFYFRS